MPTSTSSTLHDDTAAAASSRTPPQLSATARVFAASASITTTATTATTTTTTTTSQRQSPYPYAKLLYALRDVATALQDCKWRWAFFFWVVKHEESLDTSRFQLILHRIYAELNARPRHPPDIASSAAGLYHRMETVCPPRTFLLVFWLGEYMQLWTSAQFIGQRWWRALQHVAPASLDHLMMPVLQKPTHVLPSAARRLAVFSRVDMPFIHNTLFPHHSMRAHALVRACTTYIEPSVRRRHHDNDDDDDDDTLAVTVTAEASVATAWVQVLLEERAAAHARGDTDAGDGISCLGVDTETDQNVPHANRHVDLLQLATADGRVLLFRCPTLVTAVRLPTGIRYVLESKKFLKVGCACDMDAALLRRAFGVHMQNVCDLQYCVDQLGIVSDDNKDLCFRHELRRHGLAHIVHAVLGQNLYEEQSPGKNVACSCWRLNQKLSDMQIQYAAMDAFACVLVWLARPATLRCLPTWVMLCPPEES